MSIFALDEKDIIDAVGPVTPDRGAGTKPELAEVAERFARAAWSGIAEPGDAMAGLMVRTLGATAALTAIVERRVSADLLGPLRDGGADTVSRDDLASALERWAPRLAANSVLTSIRLAARCGAHLMTPGDDGWPEGLVSLGPHEPLALWVRGDLARLSRLQFAVAIVGARAATGYGEHVGLDLSASLSDRGVAIVSGAAYGIDGTAHRAALASAGMTAALLAGGVDRFYPSGHDALLHRIATEGLVMSELPCGAPPTKWRFLQRNRIIAAVSQATVVVEAGSRSGSLNTAAHAAEMGRPVGAVPGPVTSASSAGCHRLLREFGAQCITSADDVMELIENSGSTFVPAGGSGSRSGGGPAAHSATEGGAVRHSSDPDRRSRSPEEVRVLDALSLRALRNATEVALRCGLSVEATQGLLGVLMLEGFVVEGAGDSAGTGWRRVTQRR